MLSSLRKIFVACITNRIKDRLEAEIPPSQAAYRQNSSTTEHVFISKLIIKRTITARNESAHLIMVGMSIAFHSINRNQLIEDLRNTIESDELHIITVLCEYTPIYLLPCQNARTRKIRLTSRSSVCRTERKIKHS